MQYPIVCDAMLISSINHIGRCFVGPKNIIKLIDDWGC